MQFVKTAIKIKANITATSQMEWISEAHYDKERFFFSVKLTTESQHRENCSKIAVTYLHALKLGSSKSHVKKGGLLSGLNTLKQSKFFVDLKRLKHTQADLLDGF